MSDELEERNPSPPDMTAEEDELLRSEYIGDSLFSKSWVLRIIVKLLEISKNSVVLDNCNVEELDSKLETELCELWDMTINKEVVLFLESQAGMDVFLDVATKLCNMPRLMEICIGILGNMLCQEEIQIKLSNQPNLIDNLLTFFEKEDSQTLHELSRLCLMCLGSKSTKDITIEAFDQANVSVQLLFLLSTTRKSELLLSLSQLTDCYLDLSEIALQYCINEHCVQTINSICEAYHESHQKCIQAMPLLLHCLQLMTTEEEGVAAMAKGVFDIDDDCSSIQSLVVKHLDEFLLKTNTPVKEQHHAGVSCISILVALYQVKTDKFMEMLAEKKNVFGNILKLIDYEVRQCEKMQSRQLENGETESVHRDEDAIDVWLTYLTTSIDLIKRIMETVVTEKPLLLQKMIKWNSINKLNDLMLSVKDVVIDTTEVEIVLKYLDEIKLLSNDKGNTTS